MSILKELIHNHPIRRNEAQKEAFRRDVIADMEKVGLSASVEASGKHQNVIIGDPLTAGVVLTAHYDTPAASLFPNIMIPKNKALFYLYQFTPIIALLVLSMGLGYLIGEVLLGSYETFLIAFLVLYYGGYFLGFRTFENKNNHNDNTSGVAAVLSIAESIYADTRKRVAFILFDNEEKGKKGSKAYFAAHKDAMADKLVINFDCVGNGDHIVFISKGKAAESHLWASLGDTCVNESGYTIHRFSSKEADANSDHKSFPCSIGCMACSKSKRGVLYAGRIHTCRDVVAKEENVSFLTDLMSGLLSEEH